MNQTVMRALTCTAFLLAMLAVIPSARAEDETTESSSSNKTTVERVTVIRETQTTERQLTETEVPANPKVAIFIKNRAGGEYDPKVAALEDLVSSRITDLGFSVISREDAINAVASFADEGPNAGDESLPGADLDAMLSNNTSALRLAQNLGADYILTASIVSVNHSRRHFEGYGVDRTMIESIMRCSYKILERVRAGSVTGGTVSASVKNQLQAGEDSGDAHADADQFGATDTLLDKISIELAGALEQKNVQLAEAADPGTVEWTVICGTTDMKVPTVVETEDGDFVIGEQQLPINPMNVTVELNGVVVGTAPGTFHVVPGLSKVRLSREGYRDFEGTVNVVDGQTLRIDLHMTDAEYARWKDMTAFLQILKEGAKLTDAQEEAIRGYAQMLRQSGYRVDYRANTTEGIREITTNNYVNPWAVWQAPPRP